MTGSGDSHEDMERFALDPDTADRLLSGALGPEDAPHRYGEVASLLRIAAGPTSGALDGETAAVVAMVEAIRSSPLQTPAKRGRVHRHPRWKAAAAAVVAGVTLTSGLAAADALPAPAQQVAADALAVVGVHVPNPAQAPEKPPRSTPVAPDDHAGIAGTTTTSGAGVSTTRSTTARGTVPSSGTSATTTPVSQPGAGAGRIEGTSPAPAGPTATPQGSSTPGGGAGRPSAAAPPPTTAPPPDKQAARAPRQRTSGGTNGTSGANGTSGSDGASGGTVAAPEQPASTTSP